MMKKYAAPHIRLIKMDICNQLLDNSKQTPITNVIVKDGDDDNTSTNIPVHNTDKNLPSGDVNDAKGNNSWSAWDE